MKVAVLIMMFLITPVFARAAIIASNIMDNNGDWTLAKPPAELFFISGPSAGIVPTAGTDVMHFNSINSADGTNFITFAGTPFAVGDYTVTIDVGNFSNLPFPTFDPVLDIGMTAGGNLLTPTSSNTPTPALGQTLQWTYSYSITPTDPLLGQNIGFTITVPFTGVNGNVAFDNLNIDFSATGVPFNSGVSIIQDETTNSTAVSVTPTGVGLPIPAEPAPGNGQYFFYYAPGEFTWTPNLVRQYVTVDVSWGVSFNHTTDADYYFDADGAGPIAEIPLTQNVDHSANVDGSFAPTSGPEGVGWSGFLQIGSGLNLTADSEFRVVGAPAGAAPQALSTAVWRFTAAPEIAPLFELKWGSFGTGNGQFNGPRAVAVDSSGNIYVADTSNNRIQKFDSSGAFFTKWGVNGSGDGQFKFPYDVAVDSSGNVYVADFNKHRIQKFDSSGAFITKWGFAGSGDGQFLNPSGVVVDSSDNIYVADTSNHRIQKFTSGGTFITKWGSSGNGDGQFESPSGVAVDSSGNVYVTDSGFDLIQKFDSGGTFILKWGSLGSGDGQFNTPFGVAVDSSGNVYVVDVFNYRIQKFDSSGNFLLKWGTLGSGDGQFSVPIGVAVDSSGNVYVADSGNNRIQKFGPPLIVPTLTEWGIFALISVLAIAAFLRVRKMKMSEIA